MNAPAARSSTTCRGADKRWPVPSQRAPAMSDNEALYQCVGICMADPDSGYCLGCGRPPMDTPIVVAEVVAAVNPEKPPKSGDPDTPE